MLKMQVTLFQKSLHQKGTLNNNTHRNLLLILMATASVKTVGLKCQNLKDLQERLEKEHGIVFQTQSAFE